MCIYDALGRVYVYLYSIRDALCCVNRPEHFIIVHIHTFCAIDPSRADITSMAEISVIIVVHHIKVHSLFAFSLTHIFGGFDW